MSALDARTHADRPRTRRAGNRERIVAAAIELMNERGSLIGTTQMATHLSISRIIVNVVKHHPGPVPASRSDCRNLAEKMWVLWNAWPRHAELRRARTRVDPAAIARGLDMIAMTLALYVEAGFHGQVKQGLRRFSETLEGAGHSAGGLR